MIKILSIDTSTTVCSAAIHENGKLLASSVLNMKNAHSSKLSRLVDNLLANCGLSVSELDAVAVTKGPGSYTGLRIGVSFAKGICFAQDIPLLSIDSLFLIAKPLSNFYQEGVIVPMIDARRMEVYTCVFSTDMILQKEIEAKIIDEESFCDLLEQQKVFFCGDGAEKVSAVLKHKNSNFVRDVYPSAEHMGDTVIKKFQNEQFEDLAYFEPFYLKEFLVIPSKKKLL